MKRILCAAALAILPVAAFGGDLENRTEVAGFGGANWMSKEIGTHVVFGGNVGYGFDSRTLAFVEFSHNPLASASDQFGDYSASLSDIRVGVKYSLQESESFEPYVFVATGFGRFRASSPIGSTGSNHFGLHAGLGGRYYVSPKWGFTPEVSFGRYFGNASVNTVRFTGGIFFQFGQ